METARATGLEKSGPEQTTEIVKDAAHPTSAGNGLDRARPATINGTRRPSESPKKRIVIHESVQRPGPFGGTLNTTLCGRMRIGSDGMNVGTKVTCKFCLKRMPRYGLRRGKR